MKLEAIVTQIIVQQLKVEGKSICSETSFVDDLGADSLDMIELIMAFEEEFGIQIADEDAESMSIVKDLVEYLKRKHPDTCRKYA